MEWKNSAVEFVKQHNSTHLYFLKMFVQSAIIISISYFIVYKNYLSHFGKSFEDIKLTKLFDQRVVDKNVLLVQKAVE